MVLTINAKRIELDEDQISNLVSDLSDFSTEIDRTLRACGEEPDQAQLQALLKKLNLLAGVYS